MQRLARLSACAPTAWDRTWAANADRVRGRVARCENLSSQAWRAGEQGHCGV